MNANEILESQQNTANLQGFTKLVKTPTFESQPLRFLGVQQNSADDNIAGLCQEWEPDTGMIE